MSGSGRTFSDSWHRVADLRLGVRPTVTIRKQAFRGEIWYLVHDPFNNNYFRVRPEAYQFIARLEPSRTVEQVWEECLTKFPDSAPGQEEAISLLGQLHHNNLLFYRGSTDSTRAFERHEKRLQMEMKQRLMNLLFPRFNLFDPDRLLTRLMPLLRLATSWFGWLVWFAVVAAGTKAVVDHVEQARDSLEGVLGPNNWVLLYAAVVVVKALHEMGHAMLCKRYGGEVHTMGVSFLLFTPLPFVDATSAWSLRSRVHRALVGAGGMIAELFIAGLAALVWAGSGEGTVHAIAYNVIWICSVSTIVFNANPLVRLDGYYILSDLLEIPNLSSRAAEQLTYVVERWVFGCKDVHPPTHSQVEAWLLALYGLGSGAYRVLISVGIILFVADKFLLLGLAMAAFTAFTFFAVPLWQLGVYLASSPRLARTRVRATALSLATLVGVVGLLALVPVPVRFRALGVVEPVKMMEVSAECSGFLSRVVVPTGARVKTGDTLLELANRPLELSIREAEADVDEIDAAIQKAQGSATADVEPLGRRREMAVGRLDTLKQQHASLLVKSRQDGVWVAPHIAEHVGNWMDRGSVLGRVIDPARYRFIAVVLQEEASNLFLDQARKVEVRLRGFSSRTVPVKDFAMLPYQRKKLPSAALGWRGGGEVATSAKDESGLEATEPFFEIRANIEGFPGLVFMNGESGVLRFTLDSQPLLFQWARRLRQFVQRRYRT